MTAPNLQRVPVGSSEGTRLAEAFRRPAAELPTDYTAVEMRVLTNMQSCTCRRCPGTYTGKPFKVRTVPGPYRHCEACDGPLSTGDLYGFST